MQNAFLHGSVQQNTYLNRHAMKEKMFRSFVQSKSRDEHMKEVMPVHCMVAPEQVKPSRRRGENRDE